jgi:cell division septation protein DedD
MRDENIRAREKFELSLDGRQIASIVVGALVIVGVVFVLGLNVGRQIAVRQAEAARAGDLAALDRVPAPAPAAPAKNDRTFYEQLPKARPAAPPPAEPTRPPATAPAAKVAAAPPPLPPPAPAPTPTVPAAPTPTAVGTPVTASAAKVAAAPRPTSAVPASAPATHPAAGRSGGAWCVQLAAAHDRAEAERIAARWKSAAPRIETADVPGKGRYYRVRVGSFETKDVAERYLKDLTRETGAKGYVTAMR